ncbi:MAG: YfiR family protein [Propionivibrio sp.]
MPSDHRPTSVMRAARRALRRCLMLLVTLVALLVFSLACSLPNATAAGNETALKVAFLYNFALYTDWSGLGSTFSVCVIGKDDFGELLDALTRKEIGGRPIRVQRLADDKLPAECNLLFISASEVERLVKLLAPLAGRPVLTVTEEDPAIPIDTMLSVVTEQGRLTFDANMKVASAAGLTLSAKLLRLARKVY